MVVLREGDLTAEEARAYAETRAREAEAEAEADAAEQAEGRHVFRKRPKLARDAGTAAGAATAAASRPKASEASHAGGSKAANKALLSFGDDEEGDA